MMFRMRSRLVAVSLAVLAGLAGSMWATCLAADASEQEQMACCRDGHWQCPMHDSTADCCTIAAPQLQSQATIVKATSISRPIAVALIGVAHASAPIAIREFPVRDGAAETAPPGVPPYIAFSSLLI